MDKTSSRKVLLAMMAVCGQDRDISANKPAPKE